MNFKFCKNWLKNNWSFALKLSFGQKIRMLETVCRRKYLLLTSILWFHWFLEADLEGTLAWAFVLAIPTACRKEADGVKLKVLQGSKRKIRGIEDGER